MIFHLLITPLIALLDALYSALPVWNVDVGTSWLHYALAFLAPFDRFIPIHDGLLPLVTIAAAIFAGLLAFKLLKFVLSLIPTISAGG